MKGDGKVTFTGPSKLFENVAMEDHVKISESSLKCDESKSFTLQAI